MRHVAHPDDHGVSREALFAALDRLEHALAHEPHRVRACIDRLERLWELAGLELVKVRPAPRPAQAQTAGLPRLNALARRVHEVTGSVPRTWPVSTGGYEASVQYGDYWRYAVGRTEEEALDRLVELVEGGGNE